MARTRRDDERLLSKEEYDGVAKTRQPHIKHLSEFQLSDLLVFLRERRDHAGQMQKFYRRAMRGQSGQRQTHVYEPGSSAKRALLAAAVKRGNKEIERRRRLKSPRNTPESTAPSASQSSGVDQAQ
jgi:hypothetical protein